MQPHMACNVTIDDEELKLWRQVLLALVERCRDLKHRSTCEYIAASKIPLSTEDAGAPVLCSCGTGILPDNFTLEYLTGTLRRSK